MRVQYVVISREEEMKKIKLFPVETVRIMLKSQYI